MKKLNKAYKDRRKMAQRMVHNCITACGASLASLRGSWKFDDFHLSREQWTSYSDLDLVVEGITAAESQKLVLAIEDKMQGDLLVKTKIHPYESFSFIALEEARILLVGEYLLSLSCKVPQGLMSADYLRAKLSLLFLRSSMAERYVEVADRFTSVEVSRALEVKIGTRSVFPIDDALEALALADSSIVDEFCDNCLRAEPTLSYLNYWQGLVRGTISVNPWLKGMILERVAGALKIG